MPGVSRREWTKQIAGALATVPAAAHATQKVPPVGAPAPPPPPASPEERLKKAYADVRSASDQLSKLEVPMDIEPALTFRP